MTRREARELICAIARAVRERFVQRADHDQLAARVAELERQIADLTAQRETQTP